MARDLAFQILDKIGETVRLAGWVDSVRDHGKITFLDLRDRSGLVQCVGSGLPKVSVESVIEIVGLVKKRPEKLVNKNIPTGELEVEVVSMKVLSMAAELPLPVEGDGMDIDEEVRLKYRYLDLRRRRLQENIKIRSRMVQSMREYFFDNDFVEIETPLLTKSTPEGSRDFVIPSRIYPGKFFALPQSPQQYKQLLMTAGFERYFQIARALRDEDPRADRGYEHTQIDLEMSFVEREDVMQTVEAMVIYSMDKIGAEIREKPFPVFTYSEAMDKFGADKFDLRSEEEKKRGVLAFAWVIDFPFFEKNSDGEWTFTHNPFSSPLGEEHLEWLLRGENIEKITTAQYDLVCNGFEVGGGSIRTNRADVLKAVFQTMGYDEERIEREFGHMMRAFSYGTPPHGGCALGVDRLVMTVRGEEYLREVQAFPQTGRGRTSVMDAPEEISGKQLAELGIAVLDKKKK